jgi:hypothetical protein
LADFGSFSGHFWSLWDMLSFYARDFLGAFGSLQELKRALSRLHPLEPITPSHLSEFQHDLFVLDSHLRGIGLEASIAQIDRIAYALQDTKRPVQSLELANLLKDLQHRVDDELCRRVFYCVDQMKTSQFFRSEGAPKEQRMQLKPIADVFGPQVLATFFTADDHDPREATLCLIQGRNTAAVFHLMRMLEIGLIPLAAIFNVSMEHTNWGPALEEIEKHIKSMHRIAPWNALADCKDRQEVYGQAASHFDMLRIAWRNYTAHARGKYSDDEADIIFRNVKAFLDKTATMLVRYPAPAATP